MYGYAGKILDINLESGAIGEYPLSEEVRRTYLSGVGINAKILHNEVPADADPLGPENILVFNVGVLVGTSATTASRTEASAKSPLTGLFGTSNSGCYWGTQLKCAGYDGIIVRGRAKGPVYIHIEDGKAEILPAAHIWGLDAWDTIKTLRQEHNDEEVDVALIGQAGENLVRYASIENGPYNAWGRTGLGAVMGSKNLKAISVRGRGSVKVAHKKDFVKAVAETRKAVLNSPFFGPFSRFGTMLVTLPYQEHGILPGRNFQAGALPDWVETRSRKQVHKYSNRGIACIACPIACAHWVEVKEGPYAGLAIKDMEVTPVIGFGAGCDIDNLPAVAKIGEVCQRYGMDMVSTAAVVAFAMELFQRSILSAADIGFSLPWGDEEAVFMLLDLVARRRGIGDILAEGVSRAAERIPGARPYAVQVKGLEPFLMDPRGRWSTWTLGYITSIRGGDHLRTRNPVENLRYNDNPEPYLTEKFEFPEEMYKNLDMPEELKEEIFSTPAGDVDIARMAKWSEDLISLYNATGMCIRPPVLHTVGPTLLSQMYSALTGLDLTPKEILSCGERIWNVQKLFNIKHGEQPEDSDYPSRFYEEGIGSGPAQGRTLDRDGVRRCLARYYEARGWDPETGTPTAAKLKELGLDKM